MLKKGLSTNKNVPHFQPFCLYTSRTVLPTQSSHPPPQFKFGPLRQDWNTLPTREWKKMLYLVFTTESSLCKQFCLMPLQRLTSLCSELHVIFFPQILTMTLKLKGWVNIALTHHQSTLFCFHDESTFIDLHALIYCKYILKCSESKWLMPILLKATISTA